MQAKRLIRRGCYIADERDAWREHRPPTEVENGYLLERGWEEYAKWYLGIDRDEHRDVKAKYKFPFGDFEDVHLCGLASIESGARLYAHDEIETAAHELRAMIDGRRRPQPLR